MANIQFFEGASTYAPVSRRCSGDICFGLNIPENTALSGNGDIYVHISAPTTYSWVGLGQGSSMSGSQIFVMYTSANGDNVTISPRLGMGYNMPQFITGSHITLLEGSGIFNGQMTVNARCKCLSFSRKSTIIKRISRLQLPVMVRWIHGIHSLVCDLDLC